MARGVMVPKLDDRHAAGWFYLPHPDWEHEDEADWYFDEDLIEILGDALSPSFERANYRERNTFGERVVARNTLFEVSFAVDDNVSVVVVRARGGAGEKTLKATRKRMIDRLKEHGLSPLYAAGQFSNGETVLGRY